MLRQQPGKDASPTEAAGPGGRLGAVAQQASQFSAAGEGGRSEAVRTWMEVINEKPRKCSPVQGSRRKEGDCMTGQIFPSQFCTWCLLISLELHARLSSGIRPAPVPSEVASHPGLQASLLLLALSQHCRAGL